MSPGLDSHSLDFEYASSRGDLIDEFYVPCLSVADRYDRAAGYFRSSLFVMVGVAMSDFALRGGRMRLICCPELSDKDKAGIEQGITWRDHLNEALVEELQRMLEFPDNRPVVELLATLVGMGSLEIRIAYKPGEAGIFHDKLGIFEDAIGHRVTFRGSSNETYSAWNREMNHEGFEVFQSWDNDRDAERVKRHVEYFESLWENREDGLEVCELPDVPKAQLVELQNEAGIEAAIEGVRRQVAPRPHVSSEHRTLQEHQMLAVENWIAAGNRGIVDHITGGGKTITALEIIRRWVRESRPAIVFVPSELLMGQWKREVSAELDDLNLPILQAGAGAGRHHWQGEVGDFTRGMIDLGPRLVIATMQTGSSREFLNRVRGGDHLLVVADEVHRAGSGVHRNLMTIEAGGRLGLSATSERFNDPEGTRLILEYFGNPLPPPFGLEDAIRAERLVPYDYYIHKVALTPEEQQSWEDLTDQISEAYARLPEDAAGLKQANDQYVFLLIKRARILKQAIRKVEVAEDVVSTHYSVGDRWLVYCDDMTQLSAVRRRLESLGLSVHEYHSAMEGSSKATLEHFETFGGVLVAIRCLDEGVDIPSLTHALILASSTNSREFIQRRGRVLRSAPNKYSAAVHDSLVVALQQDGTPTAMPSELRRAVEFASSARNANIRHELQILERRGNTEGTDEYEVDEEEE